MTDLTIVDDAFNSVGSAGEAALDTVVGGAVTAFDAVARPRRSAGRARRRGSEVNETLIDAAEEVLDVATGLPERVLLTYLRAVRRQAGRRDVLGAASRTVLGAVHGSARDWARFFSRLERETDVRGAGRTRTTARRSSGTARATGRRRTTTRGSASTTTRRRSTSAGTRRGTGSAAGRRSGTATPARRGTGARGRRSTTRRSA